jgi:hypothetical protein
MTARVPIRTFVLVRTPHRRAPHEEGQEMPKYVIERTVPGAGQMDETALRAIAAQSNAVLQEMGPTIQWVNSYVSDDKITCIYYATDEDVIREHGRLGGFPVDVIELVHATIDPTTAAPLA